MNYDEGFGYLSPVSSEIGVSSEKWPTFSLGSVIVTDINISYLRLGLVSFLIVPNDIFLSLSLPLNFAPDW